MRQAWQAKEGSWEPLCTLPQLWVGDLAVLPALYPWSLTPPFQASVSFPETWGCSCLSFLLWSWFPRRGGWHINQEYSGQVDWSPSFLNSRNRGKGCEGFPWMKPPVCITRA